MNTELFSPKRFTVIFILVFLLFQWGCQKDKPSNQKFFTNAIGMEFVYIPKATFTMGSPPDEPKRHHDEVQHPVALLTGFYMSTTEVTQGQWHKVMGDNPSEFMECGEQCPVESISWNDVQNFIKQLNKIEENKTYRLPTEAEWEYACRAGTDTPFSYGKCLSTEQANFDGRTPLDECPRGKYRERVTPVAKFPPNPWGLYDMHGNVWEWCQDWYGTILPGPATDPTGPSSGKYKVVRGGSWFSLDDDCRSANRDRSAPNLGLNFIGFRLVMMP